MEEIFKELEEVFREVFDDDSISLCAETSPDNMEGWDSLSQLHLLVSVEQRFGIKMGVADIAAIKSAGDIARIVMEKRASGGSAVV